MKKSLLKIISGAALTVAMMIPAQAAVIGFTGGTVTMNDSSTGTTNNAVVFADVAKYEESGFRLSFIGGNANYIGDYYSGANDVIHGHWATGDYGGLTRILITKIDGTSFDMNYFVLTSNTDFGGGAASGNERTFIHASADGVNDDYAQLLPSEDWGFPSTQVFLGSQFDSVKAVWFDVANSVDCFGMDNFYIDQSAPGLPEPTSLALAGLALLGLAALLRRRPL